ncbi:MULTISPECIES: hypothetical protein [unclassified Snodgrassella]|uniref:hypothetical protein n=1 Tax=unclassified Snodgrassella TaxID=2625236 RepID=UPI0018DE0F55|nr:MULTISPECIES: hypothetical protein [unclassified Snodgrassella]MBI0159802.1 hypothetical protein [Snodgrassella sp. W6238H11]MBI0161983.1 hypothetical protein [Snodgrassella sp. W6238H14]
MQQVYELIPSSNENSGIKFGGGAFIDGQWPQNPLGENLTLLFTIDNDKLSDSISGIVNTPLLAHKPSRKSCYLFHISIFNGCHII